MLLAEIAERLGCELAGDGSLEIHRLVPIEEAEGGHLSFVANPRYRRYLDTTRASALIVGTDERPLPVATLRSTNPYLAFARAIELFYEPLPCSPEIHPTAVIAASARIGDGATIGPFCSVGNGVVLGARARLDAHVVIYPEVTIGDDFRAYSHVTVRERVTIGNRVALQPGCVIGGDGFGYVADDRGGIKKIIQAGTVVIEDDVEVGANTTIDRATIGVTRIGRGAKIDNLVQIAHGCSVGSAAMVAAQTGLSGSTKVGRGVRLGGQVGTAGHLSIGDGAQVAAQSGVPGDVAPGTIVGGYPAEPIATWRRISAALPRLPELLRRVRRLEDLARPR